MKKIIALAIAAVILLSLCACGGHNSNTPSGNGGNTTANPGTTDGNGNGNGENEQNTAAPSDETPSGQQPANTPEPVPGSEGLASKEEDDYCVITGAGDFTGTDLVIPSHINGKPVKKIDESAFRENTAITSVTIPWTVTKIDEDAFAGCKNIDSLTLSEGLEIVGESAFYGCESLKTLTIPKSVTSIDGYAFRSCTGVEEITLLGCCDLRPNSFSDCSSLKTFSIKNPDGISYQIHSNALSGCNALENLDLAPGLTSIGSWNFADTPNLKTVFLPKSLTQMDACVFLRSGVETVYYEGTEEEWKAITIKEATFTPAVEYNKSR
ncbi:MAG: leucine-rich repeat domain-containing protein [Clostridia bacterium]|nr:leucine-rich repeat domain-containing protein [Clostridia bacterium]